jgi:hypothetical protein
VANLVFSSDPISGALIQQSNNLVAAVAKASTYVKSPAFTGVMNFYPLAGQCQGAPLDLSDFHTDSDYSLDFNGASKVAAKGAALYRGAYAGERSNPGWELRAGLKAPSPPAPHRAATLVWLSPVNGQAGSTVQLILTGAGFTPEASVAVGGPGTEVSNVKVEGPTRITATLRIAGGTASGARAVTVNTASGVSNAATFRINAGRPKG